MQCKLCTSCWRSYLSPRPPCSCLPRDNGRTTSHSHRRPEALSSEQKEAGRHTVTPVSMSDRRYGYSYPPPQGKLCTRQRPRSFSYIHARGNCLTIIYVPGNAGYYNNGPPVMAPPPYQYAAPPPPRREPSFLEGW